ncbi:MAG: ribonuclease P protein component [Candidatus Yanofskybacteria bacterium]|nr:ribonuclease P protein component [Candidatus Yanofskybacteria bacterium]
MAIPSKHRLTGAKQYATVFKEVRPISSEHLALRVRRIRESQNTRFGVTVSVKLAPKAVLRNAVRRSVSEVVRRVVSRRDIPDGSIAVFSVKKLPLPNAATLHAEVVSLLQKSAILVR